MAFIRRAAAARAAGQPSFKAMQRNQRYWNEANSTGAMDKKVNDARGSSTHTGPSTGTRSASHGANGDVVDGDPRASDLKLLLQAGGTSSTATVSCVQSQGHRADDTLR